MIVVNNISVSYRYSEQPTNALNNISMNINKGEYISILGPNGSGKSTLIKAICGMVALNSGEIRVNDATIKPGCFGEELFGRVGVVFQEPEGQFLMPDVRREISAVLENAGLSLDMQKRKFDELVSQFSLKDILQNPPDRLSGGQTQLVNIACALAPSPDVLLLDEPTTFLDTRFRRIILEMLDTLFDGNLTIIHVTQYSDEAYRSRRVVILDGGEIAADGPSREILGDQGRLDEHRLIMPVEPACEKWLGIDMNDEESIDRLVDEFGIDVHSSAASKEESKADTEPVLCVNRLRFRYPTGQFEIFIDNLNLFKGMVAGLIGPGGSGKTTLAFLLAGLLKPRGGEILLDDLSMSECERRILRLKISICWQMPEAAFIGPRVADDLKLIEENLELRKSSIPDVLKSVNLSGFEGRIVDSLSGGEKRKLSLAAAMLADPTFYILDEPSAFLDPHSQKEIGTIVRGLAKSGKAVLVIGHDLPFMAEITDRVIGIKNGAVEFDIASNDFFNNPSYLNRLGLPPEPMIEVRRKLTGRGVSLSSTSIDPRRIAVMLGR